MSLPRLAVLDLGSNTIKILVVDAGPPLTAVGEKTIEAGLAKGMSRNPPTLTSEGMGRALDAVVKLVGWAGMRGTNVFLLTATAAVRDAVNGPEFAEKVKKACGHPLRILTGEEEARGIALGVQQDPALGGARDFYLTDLGGGSMEFVDFHDGRIAQAVSLPIGSVRMAEQYLGNLKDPVPEAAWRLVADHTRKALAENGFRFDRKQPLVCTGGAANHARGARELLLPKGPGGVTAAHLRALLERLAPLPARQREALLPGLSANRAELLPAAAATLLAVMETAGLPEYVTSYHNLRWGVAAEWFAARR